MGVIGSIVATSISGKREKNTRITFKEVGEPVLCFDLFESGKDRNPIFGGVVV